MIQYKEHILGNGLTVLACRDESSRMAAVNVLYGVGARDEEPEHTGFAHLFEHLMFRGTRAVPHFDIPVQEAAGENNAFTNNDYTDYYITLPAENIETALWLEADRMTGLDISPEALETEKKVVIEEFNQRYLNQPYGDQWLLLRAMAYKNHPYRWPTIGLETGHIAKAGFERVRAFYKRYYTPSNAILSVVSPLAEEVVFALVERYFGTIPATEFTREALPVEPAQLSERRQQVRREGLPATAVTIAFHIGDRLSREFYVCDVISDLLSGGTSARLYQRLVKERQFFSSVNAYVTGDVDPGLIVLSGYLHEGVLVADAEQALWEQLALTDVSEHEMQKVRNKFEANVLLGEFNVMNKAMNLGYYKFLGDMSLLNGEVALQSSITALEVAETARRVFTRENSSTLIMENG